MMLPEMMRVELSNVILKLMGLGITDLLGFEMIDRPPEHHLVMGIDTLYAYGLIDQEFNLTEKGKKAAELSLDTRSACMLLSSFDSRFGCSKEILILVSMLQVHRELFTNNSLALLKAKKKIGTKEGDFLTLINMFLKYTRAKTNDQKRVCSEFKLNPATMHQAVLIHDQLLQQVKSFRKGKSSYQEML